MGRARVSMRRRRGSSLSLCPDVALQLLPAREEVEVVLAIVEDVGLLVLLGEGREVPALAGLRRG
eukprot:3269720-Pleurochrysis_carterae.AAC.1